MPGTGRTTRGSSCGQINPQGVLVDWLVDWIDKHSLFPYNRNSVHPNIYEASSRNLFPLRVFPTHWL